MAKNTGKGIWIIVGILIGVALLLFLLIGNMKSGSYTNTNPNPNAGVNTQLPSNNGAGSEAGSSSSSYDINIKSYIFDPEEINIKVGDTITWTNMDSVQHTITSVSGKELASAKLLRGERYSHTFNKAGTYYYYCTIHPSMKAKVIVV